MEDAGVVRVRVSGNWHIAAPPPGSAPAEALLRDPAAAALELVDESLAGWDTSLVATLARLTALAGARSLPVRRHTLPAGVNNLIDLALAVPAHAAGRKKDAAGWCERIGAVVSAMPAVCLDVVAFIGETARALGRFFPGGGVCGARSIRTCVRESGADALPIVCLVSLLVGLILAFVGVVQLRMFGAEVYIASLVVIGMTRIMGAVMTGVVLAGRTGASYAAVIGSMRVNEEVDALEALGIPPVDYLVLPRIVALALMTPLLVLYADFMGILGGFLVGSLALGIDPLEYLTFTRRALHLNHLLVGMVHGFAFGLIVAISGCYQGLRCARSTEGVGVATTAAVVNAIVFIILATAALTMVCNAAGI
jgi:phospholipid/cholesterol/gamma-HCH transport system permease protein